MQHGEDRVVSIISQRGAHGALLIRLVGSCSHKKYWTKISQEAKDFILALVRANPDERPTADEALKLKVTTTPIDRASSLHTESFTSSAVAD